MAHIKTDDPQPGSRPFQASAIASTSEINSVAPTSDINWRSDWRESTLFTFRTPDEKKNPTKVVPPETKETSQSSPLTRIQKLPTSFNFDFSLPKVGNNKSSCGSSEFGVSSDTPASERETGNATDPVPSTHATLADLMKKQTMDRRRQLLHRIHNKDVGGLDEIKTAPLFTETARARAERQASSSVAFDQAFSQYGLLAGDASSDRSDELFYYNVAAPSSTFICGSQGSGKSHTLSCLLENSLFPSVANELPRPLTGIVFHYDTFISDSQGSPCEAAYLSSNAAVRVRVLCAPTNLVTISRTYAALPNVTVEPLSIRERDLTTRRMMDLMAVKKGEAMPLYMHVVNRVLRDLRLRQQQTGGPFDYRAFKAMLAREDLTESQRVPLSQRLETLESFMAPTQGPGSTQKKKNKTEAAAIQHPGNDWTPRAGQLTVVDLSCPCITPEGACSLFNICLSLFLEQDSRRVGRIVALDEAHKYMNESGEASALTEQLLATIRLQRHLGARVVISTQEPTVSPRLLDLCSVTIVHRFTSPEWLRALRRHLAGAEETAGMLARAAGAGAGAGAGDAGGVGDSAASSDSGVDDVLEGVVDAVGTMSLKEPSATVGRKQAAANLFAQIVGLRVGEALVFSPNAVVGVSEEGVARKLGSGVLKVCVRNRVTEDGGRSVMAG
ncbi:hypothetical protein KVR01_002117 [Diaporthe batatas]|uniref:uncharacterized protein n=1 Tax=Diaporthe batatas TaxID=748121 RepID=UPI001D042770|nr:uncharacterized protein KVR01_002117 [Diaporthe batatas]KAG8166428.1 hypothetical protein KVR01_002117 [Diaporthe batatas]